MKISRDALNAFNSRVDVTFNDHYNLSKKYGTKAENDRLYKLSSELFGIARDDQQITPAMIRKAGLTFKGN